MSWIKVCSYEDLVANAGIAVKVMDKQVAIFLDPEFNQLFALSNWDPIGKANVMSRGLMAEIEGVLTVASPLYKQKYCLSTGVCIDEDIVLPIWNVKLENDVVWLAPK
ncbi:nitrite reductase small subunit NirD [Marinomonas sp. 15G1-11]|uniref:Nitrite reductase small subunit NirD n=1 Tax=Marinomonas phaeophyticola TaxID=3004091 RepID=A0ABT4JYK2_9GAMM|nr:nitrite reductase small subunit NirD [Marinomonas sp. 15G1-11]MCZ2723409.1 nitrite reductase small subunit NirD [Marinomonas sp. 15G1-11]